MATEIGDGIAIRLWLVTTEEGNPFVVGAFTRTSGVGLLVWDNFEIAKCEIINGLVFVICFCFCFYILCDE